MTIIVVILILISAVLATSWNYILKKVINQGGDSVTLYWSSSIINLILFLIPFFSFFLFFKINLSGLFFAALSGFFMSFYVIFLSKSYQHGDLSLVFPLTKITPIFTLIIGIFLLNEDISPLQISGIFLIVLGAYAINSKKFTINNLFKPLVSLKHQASFLAVLAAIMSALYGLSFKLGSTKINFFMLVYLTYFFFVIFYTPFLSIKKNNLLSQFKKFKTQIIAIALLNFFSFNLVIIALSISTLSYVFAFRQVSILFTVILGIYLLKEKYGTIRIISSIIILIGLILVSVF